MSQLSAKMDEIRKFMRAEFESLMSNPQLYDSKAADDRRRSRFSLEELSAYASQQHLDRAKERAKGHTPQEILEAMDKTNFLMEDECVKFFQMLERVRRPFFPLGTSDGVGYSVSLAVDVLQPHFADTSAAARPGMFDVKVLGVNLNVEPDPLPHTEDTTQPQSSQKRCQQESLEEIMKSTETDDADIGNGFCFAQIGHLGVSDGADWNHVRSDLRKARDSFWTLPGYAVVLELDNRGRAQGVWVIMNFFPTVYDEYDIPETCSRIDIRTAELLHTGEDEPFTMARIASSVKELLVDNPTMREFEFERLQTTKVQIVCAKRQGPYLLRQFIRSEAHASSYKG